MARNQSHFQLRRDTNENWLKANPILKSGEPGFVTDTGALKIGNGKDTFSALAEIAGGDPGQGGGNAGTGDVVVLNMEFEPAQEEGKMLVYCDIDKDELIGYMQDDNAFIGYLNMSDGNSIQKQIINILGFSFSDEDVQINGTIIGGNQNINMWFEYNDETSRLEATVDAEPEEKPKVYVVKINNADGNNPLALTTNQGNEIASTLRNGGIAYISLNSEGGVGLLPVIGFEDVDGEYNFYVMDQTDKLTFAWDANTSTYVLDQH